MTYYSKPIKMPLTRKEGLLNFVQMVINQIEGDRPQEALLTAVDLLDTLSGKANPFSSVTDGGDNAMVAELKRQHAQELSAAIARAHARGVEDGIASEKTRMAQALGLLVA